MTASCDGLGFTEIVKCEIENGRQIAQGWAQCHGRTWTGRGGHYSPYSMPSGWEYDPRYVDKFGGLGTHGGCQYCSMALIHLRKILSEPPAPTPTPTPTPVTYPIGTKVTHNSERWVVIGYEPPLTSRVYKLQALYDGRRTTATGELFAEIALPRRTCETYKCSESRCYGEDKYALACYGGVCIQGTLIEANSEDCGYEKPYPTPTPTTDMYTYAIIALMVVGTYIMMRR